MSTVTPDTVRELRRAMKSSQIEMANRLGVARSSIQNWESGRRSPSPMAAEKIRKLCEEYHIT